LYAVHVLFFLGFRIGTQKAAALGHCGAPPLVLLFNEMAERARALRLICRSV
jgi:hypothetical protein